MEDTVIKQVDDTTTSLNSVGKENSEEKVDVTPVTPYKTFNSKDEFDRHSAGILNSAQKKAEKELLAMLGLKPDEKDKLAKFKTAYDNTLSDAEKQTKTIETLTSEITTLKNNLSEKEALIVALKKLTTKANGDVDKYVKMAKGLVDENTNIEQALDQVLALMKMSDNPKPSAPVGKPLTDTPTKASVEENPFKTGNLTKQGELIKSDREKARALYLAVYGKGPSW